MHLWHLASNPVRSYESRTTHMVSGLALSNAGPTPPNSGSDPHDYSRTAAPHLVAMGAFANLHMTRIIAERVVLTGHPSGYTARPRPWWVSSQHQTLRHRDED